MAEAFQKLIEQRLLQPEATLRSYTPSPSEERRFWLEQNLGWRAGGGVNDMLDWVDPVTPFLDFKHRRDQDTPYGLDDVFLAAGAIPGPGKLMGKVGKEIADQSIKMGRRVPPYKRIPSTQQDFSSEIANVLKTGQSSKGGLFRSDLGEITIDFGKPGDPAKKFKGGWGLDHIRQKRSAEFAKGHIKTSPDAFRDDILPQVLADGKLSRIDQSSNRVHLTLTRNGVDYKAVLRRDRSGQHETWLLTAMERYPTRPIDKWGHW